MIDVIVEQPQKASSDMSEFSVHNSDEHLLDYNLTDMELLFGNDFMESEGRNMEASSSRNSSSVESEAVVTSVNELRVKGEELLVMICSLLHELGLCDEFIYKE